MLFYIIPDWLTSSIARASWDFADLPGIYRP